MPCKTRCVSCSLQAAYTLRLLRKLALRAHSGREPLGPLGTYARLRASLQLPTEASLSSFIGIHDPSGAVKRQMGTGTLA